MSKTFLLVLASQLLISACFCQDAETLNRKANELLKIQDFKNAVPILQQAAALGNMEAQYNCGICYQQGIEVTQSDSIANDWFLKAALQGFKDAQYKIAYSYSTGRGLAQNNEKAFFWSLQCAAQQDPDCLFEVISCYMNGRGTTKNIDSMLVWARRLALLETPDDLRVSGQITSARANLATIYGEGKYVSKDPVKSYIWYLIYNESKRDFSVLEQQKNINAIKALEETLPQSAKEQAKLKAEELLKKKLMNMENLYKQEF